MTTVRELVVEWGFDVDEAELRKAEQGIEKIKGALTLLTTAAAAAGASLFAFAQTTANALNEVKDLSIATSTSVEDFQKLAFAASQTGNDTTKLAEGLKVLSERVREADKGGNELSEIFARLGVQLRDQQGTLRPINEIFLDLGDGIRELGAGTERTALLAKLFGGGMVSLGQTLQEGRAGITALTQEYERFGGVFNQDQVDTAVQFNDSLRALGFVLRGVANRVGLEIIPVFVEFFDKTRDLIIANSELIQVRLVDFLREAMTFLRRVGSTISTVIDVVFRFKGAVQALIPDLDIVTTLLKAIGLAISLTLLGRLTQGFFELSRGAIALAKGLQLANLSALAIPLAIGAAVAAIFLIIDDVIAFTEGRPSVLGFLVNNQDKILKAITDALNSVKEWLLDSLEGFAQAFFEFFGVPGDQAEAAAARIRAAFEGAFEFLKTGFKTVMAIYEEFGVALYQVFEGVSQTIVDLLNDPIETINRLPELLTNALTGLVRIFSTAGLNIGEIILSALGADQFAKSFFDSMRIEAERFAQFLKDAIGGLAGGGFSFLDKAVDFGVNLLGSGVQATADSLAKPQPIGGGTQTVDNSTSVSLEPRITINQAPGQSSEAVADSVNRALKSALDSEYRQTIQRASSGARY